MAVITTVATTPTPSIDRFGLTLPPFNDVITWLREIYRSIYGEDIYIAEDSQDGQFIGISSQGLHDFASVVEATYNAYSPSTAQGEGLSRVVKINGIRRHAATYSQADLRIIGQPGTQILNGVVGDVNGFRWLLPAEVLVPESAELIVFGRAQEKGAIAAAADTITQILTPTRGWQRVSNPRAAQIGAPVEDDPHLRVRQTVSTEIPSRSLTDGIVGAVAKCPGVTRYRVFDADDWAPIPDTPIPGNAIAVVVEGGDPALIADVIRRKKPPGTMTYGLETQTIPDAYGIQRTIRYTRPTLILMRVIVPIKIFGGYSLLKEDNLRKAVSDFINSLNIGQDVIQAQVNCPANLGNDPSFIVQNLKMARNEDAVVEGDVDIAWNERAICTTNRVTVQILPNEST
jgi:uncharacterized phage protein gp47/JayE